MANQGDNLYDLVPYPSRPFPQTHPDRLHTLAALLGLRAANVERCRVLEIGCGQGGNLIPLGQTLPDSEFVGIDASAKQIELGRQVVEAVSLNNVDLRAENVTELGQSLGQFDYIICHGVFSWVDDPTREALLNTCATRLSSNGLAYVSYNTHPGWHVRRMVRDMMRYHAGKFSQPLRQVRQARLLLDFLVASVKDSKEAYHSVLRRELDEIRRQSDAYLLHEQLAEYNEPMYFHQFVEAARAHGLEYLGESDSASMVAFDFSAQVRETLSRIAQDRIQYEQYLDFLRDRTFRQSVLCRQEVKPRHSISADELFTLRVASSAEVHLEVSEGSPAAITFRTADAKAITTSDSIVKVSLESLGQAWPQSISWRQLRDMARDRLAAIPGSKETAAKLSLQTVGNRLSHCIALQIVQLRNCADRFTSTISARPVTTSLARYEAANGEFVTTLLHEPVRLNALDAAVLSLLDGKKDLSELATRLMKLEQSGQLKVEFNKDGSTVNDAADRAASFVAAVEQSLDRLRMAPLLLA